MAAGTEPDLEERVAALEAALGGQVAMAGHVAADMGIPAEMPMTEEQVAEFRIRFAEAARHYEYRIIPQPPPLSPDEIRQLLSECVTVVKPGETLVIRGRDWTPMQTREIQQVMDGLHEDGQVPFRALAVFGDELAVAEPGPDFMSQVRADTFRDGRGEIVRLTHLPTGVTVEAPSRPEAIAKLSRAIERHARRHAEGVPGAA